MPPPIEPANDTGETLPSYATPMQKPCFPGLLPFDSSTYSSITGFPSSSACSISRQVDKHFITGLLGENSQHIGTTTNSLQKP